MGSRNRDVPGRSVWCRLPRLELRSHPEALLHRDRHREAGSGEVRVFTAEAQRLVSSLAALKIRRFTAEIAEHAETFSAISAFSAVKSLVFSHGGRPQAGDA